MRDKQARDTITEIAKAIGKNVDQYGSVSYDTWEVWERLARLEAKLDALMCYLQVEHNYEEAIPGRLVIKKIRKVKP